MLPVSTDVRLLSSLALKLQHNYDTHPTKWGVFMKELILKFWN